MVDGLQVPLCARLDGRDADGEQIKVSPPLLPLFIGMSRGHTINSGDCCSSTLPFFLRSYYILDTYILCLIFVVARLSVTFLNLAIFDDCKNICRPPLQNHNSMLSFASPITLISRKGTPAKQTKVSRNFSVWLRPQSLCLTLWSFTSPCYAPGLSFSRLDHLPTSLPAASHGHSTEWVLIR